MIRTYSAQLVEYNANDRGNYAPDCVKRALSMAFSVPYGEIAKELRAAQKSGKNVIIAIMNGICLQYMKESSEHTEVRNVFNLITRT